MAMKPPLPLALIMVSLYPGYAWCVDPQTIDIYGFDFTPTLTFSEAYDDNFRELEHNVQSSMVTRMAPSFELKAEDRNSATRLIWQPARYIYHDESDASVPHNVCELDSIMEFTDRHRLKLEAECAQIRAHESTAVDGINDKIQTANASAVSIPTAPKVQPIRSISGPVTHNFATTMPTASTTTKNAIPPS